MVADFLLPTARSPCCWSPAFYSRRPFAPGGPPARGGPPCARRSAAVRLCYAEPSCDELQERSAKFHPGLLFYRPASRIIRDLGVLALAALSSRLSAAGDSRNAAAGIDEGRGLRVLDAMSGSGVRALRYAQEVPGVGHVHANDLMLAYGDHPLGRNLQQLAASDAAQEGVVSVSVSARSAVDLYFEARLGGASDLYDLVDVDAFGTGQPHTAEAWRPPESTRKKKHSHYVSRHPPR